MVTTLSLEQLCQITGSVADILWYPRQKTPWLLQHLQLL